MIAARLTHRDVSDSGSVASNVKNHGRQNDRCKRLVQSDTVVWQFSVRVKREEMESDGGENQGERHSGNRGASDAATSNLVDDGQCHQSEDEAANGRLVSGGIKS